MSDPSHPLARTDFYREIRRNKWRTAVILLGFVALIVAAGVAVDILLHFGVVGVAVALALALALAFFSYFNSDKVALAAARARPADGPEYQRYHNLVEGLCIAAGLPKPRLYVVDDPAPNAFATGRNPKHAALAVTTGLLEEMNRVELEGVVAHELSHVKNYDILASTVAVVAVGAIVLLADIGLRFWIFGAGDDDRGGNDNGFGIVIAIAAIGLLIFAPIAAQLMQFAMSRKRELLADATGVQLTRYPPGLLSALKKLQSDQAVVKHATRATAQMWIESPLDRNQEKGKRGSWLNRAFDTHPPLEERIKILESM